MLLPSPFTSAHSLVLFHRRWLFLLFTLLAGTGATRAEEKPIILQLKWYHQFQFAGYYAAEAKGYYKSEGLNVVIQEASPTRPPLETVLSGQADFGVSDDDILLARLRGKPTVACAAIFQHSPYIVMARADRGIHKPSDLVGKTVMAANDQGSAQLKAMLTREGIPFDQVKIVPHSWKNKDLIEGRVDAITAYSTVEPTQMRQAGVEPSVIRVTDYGVDFYGDTLFTTESFIKKDRNRVAAFIRASRLGWEYAMSHPQEMIDLILRKPEVQARGIKRENLVYEAEEMRPLIQPDVVEIGHMNPGRWERMAQVFRETGMTTARLDVDKFVFESETHPDWRVLWTLAGILGAALLVMALILLWNAQLRRKVDLGTREIRESGAKLHALIENATASIWSVDLQHRLVTFNSVYREYTEEVAGHPVTVGMHVDEILPPEAAAEWKLNYERAAKGEHFHLIHSYPMPRGVRSFDVSFSPIDAEGEVTGVAIFSFDITNRRELEEQLRQAQKMDAIGQLAGGVAHDFNNLLMVIQGNASLAQMSELPKEETEAIFQDILTATERASALTGQLLAFSRRQPMQPRDIDANALVAEAGRMLQRLIGEDITLETQFTREHTLVHADPALIEQVLLNLAVNARDALPRGGRVTLRTTISRETERPIGAPKATAEDFVRIEVIDNGVGIAPEDLPHIFEPFFTTKEVGKGTGLGLATAFGIAQQHGGWLTVTSEVGQGSNFSLLLPLHHPAPKKTPAPIASTKPARSGSETILVVEDETTVRAVVVHALRLNGYKIYEAVSGQSALEVWEKHGPEIDLLLTDMVMPGGLTGHDLAQQLLERKPALKVIYTSGYSAEVFRGDFVLPPGVAFLRKPYRAEELLTTVRQAFDGRS